MEAFPDGHMVRRYHSQALLTMTHQTLTTTQASTRLLLQGVVPLLPRKVDNKETYWSI